MQNVRIMSTLKKGALPPWSDYMKTRIVVAERDAKTALSCGQFLSFDKVFRGKYNKNGKTAFSKVVMPCSIC